MKLLSFFVKKETHDVLAEMARNEGKEIEDLLRECAEDLASFMAVLDKDVSLSEIVDLLRSREKD